MSTFFFTLHVFLHKFRVVELSRVYPHHPAERQQNKKNHRLKSMVLVPGWSRGYPGLHFSSSCEFPKCFCWGALVGATPLHLLSQTALPLKSPTGAFRLLRKRRSRTPNPAGNVYGKLEFIFFFLNIGILLICIAGTHFRMLLSKNLPLH